MTDRPIDKDFGPEPEGPEELSAEAAAEPFGPPPVKGLTIPPNRLAGSDNCLNCGTGMQGPFCHYCGQPDKHFMRFFPVLVRDLITDLLDLDSRFFRTMKALLLQPGKLTRDFIDGQRFRYTPPLRLYIFSSIAFFFLAALLASSAVTVTSEDTVVQDAVETLRDGSATEEELREAREALDDIRPGLGDQVGDALARASEENAEDAEVAESAAEAASSAAEETATGDEDADNAGIYFKDDGNVVITGLEDDDDEININGEPWDPVTNPVIIPLVPQWVNDWVNDEIGESPQKGKEIEQNPNLIIDKMFDVLPATMFVLLPLSALILKFWYLFSGRYYIEHLILALHNHSFLFVVFLCTMLLDAYAGWREPGEQGWITDIVFWVTLVLYLWIPVYFLLSLKRVYQQGWFLTGAKYVVVGLSYIVLLTTAAAVAALTSFVLL